MVDDAKARALADFEVCISALALELPTEVWVDVKRRFNEMKAALSVGDETEGMDSDDLRSYVLSKSDEEETELPVGDEPVAWQYRGLYNDEWYFVDKPFTRERYEASNYQVRPLYAAPVVQQPLDMGFRVESYRLYWDENGEAHSREATVAEAALWDELQRQTGQQPGVDLEALKERASAEISASYDGDEDFLADDIAMAVKETFDWIKARYDIRLRTEKDGI